MRTLLIAVEGLAVAIPGATSATVTCVGDNCVVNNGLAPPNSENVIDDGVCHLVDDAAANWGAARSRVSEATREGRMPTPQEDR
jgi:hypothetical protein